MSTNAFDDIFSGLSDGSVVPYLGPGALKGVTDPNGKAIPADSDSLILAMNNGQPMAPKLMYEFPRAAMNVELKRGRKAVNKFLDATYKDTQWSASALHAWLAQQKLPYIVDCNRDTQMQLQYAGTPHTLIVGIARISGKEYRFRLFHFDGSAYAPIEQEAVDTTLPVLFKPLATPPATVPQTATFSSRAAFARWNTSCWGIDPNPMVRSPAMKVTIAAHSAGGQNSNLPDARACSTTGATPSTPGMSATTTEIQSRPTTMIVI
jgi:hypothetical protein